MEDVPHASKEGTGLTAESTPTATIVPKVKDTEDQSVHQDDPQDFATMSENQDETLVLSGSDIVTEGEGEGRGGQERGGVNSGGTASPLTRKTSSRCWEPSILYESQPMKRFRLG